MMKYAESSDHENYGLILTLLGLILSISAVISTITLACKPADVCQKLAAGPLVAAAVYLLIISIVGFIGDFYGVDRLSRVRYPAMVLFFIVLFGFIIISWLAGVININGGAGQVLSDRRYKEYRIGDYSDWWQKRVNDSNNWNRIKTCLINWNVCQDLAWESNTPQHDFFNKQLSPLESGCCKPPENCEFTYVAPTNWIKTGTPTNPDCNAWDNNPNTLCYDCTSCKAGFLANNWLLALAATSSSSSLSTLPVVVLCAIFLIHGNFILDD